MSFFYTVDLDKQASLLQAAILAGKLLQKGTRYREALKLVCQEVYCYNEEIVSTDEVICTRDAFCRQHRDAQTPTNPRDLLYSSRKANFNMEKFKLYH